MATPTAGPGGPRDARPARGDQAFACALAASLVLHLGAFLANPLRTSEAQNEISDRDLSFLVERAEQGAQPTDAAAPAPRGDLAAAVPGPFEPPPEAPAAPEPEPPPVPAPQPAATAEPPRDAMAVDPPPAPAPVAAAPGPARPPAAPPTAAPAPTQPGISRLTGLEAARQHKRAVRYLQIVRQRILDHLVVPDEAIQQSLHGFVHIQVTILRSGKVRETRFLQECPYPLLNSAAKLSIYRAAPFPNLEGLVDLDYIKLNVPFQY